MKGCQVLTNLNISFSPFSNSSAKIWASEDHSNPILEGPIILLPFLPVESPSCCSFNSLALISKISCSRIESGGDEFKWFKWAK